SRSPGGVGGCTLPGTGTGAGAGTDQFLCRRVRLGGARLMVSGSAQPTTVPAARRAPQISHWVSSTLKVRGRIISQANSSLGGFCSCQRIFPHSTQCSGKGYHHAAKPSAGEDLDIAEPVACWHAPAFHLHPTLASRQGAAL